MTYQIHLAPQVTSLTSVQKQILTDKVYIAYHASDFQPYTWETYWKHTKQHHFNVWVYLLNHHPEVKNHLDSKAHNLSFYFYAIRDSGSFWFPNGIASPKNLKFDHLIPDLAPDNQEYIDTIQTD